MDYDVVKSIEVIPLLCALTLYFLYIFGCLVKTPTKNKGQPTASKKILIIVSDRKMTQNKKVYKRLHSRLNNLWAEKLV